MRRLWLRVWDNLIRQKVDVGVSLPRICLPLRPLSGRPKSCGLWSGFHFNYNISECKFCDCDRIWARGKPSQSEEVKPIVPPPFHYSPPGFSFCLAGGAHNPRHLPTLHGKNQSKPSQTSHFRCSFECLGRKGMMEVTGTRRKVLLMLE